MAPKRAIKAKAEEVVAEPAADVLSEEVPAKKRGGRSAKAALVEEVVKNGAGKRGKNIVDNDDVAEPAEEKSPAKRGRRVKADGEPQPPEKNTKAEENEEEPKKRGRKPVAEKMEPVKAAPKGKKAKVEEESDDDDEPLAEAPEETKMPEKRARKKVEAKNGDEEEKPAAKKRGAKAEGEPDAKKPLLNKTSSDFTSIDYGCDKLSASGETWNFKISSWNVDGIRAWLNKGGLQYIHHEKPDILCLQETKCSTPKLPGEVASVPGYHAYWLTGDQEGYAGVGVYTKKTAINVTYGLGSKELDTEGRIITAEYEQFYLICTYVPNAGRGLVTMPKRLQWNDEFKKYVKGLDAKKPVIICGDMNVSHLEIDLTNPKTNKKSAGFTQEERDGMTDLLGDGFVDTFRNLYPDKTGAYTFWTYMMNCRAKNVGWRLDYAIVSERLMPSVCDNTIRSQVFGSDHCPITLFLHVN